MDAEAAPWIFMHGCGSVGQGEDIRHSSDVVMMPVSHYNVLSSHVSSLSSPLHYLYTARLLVQGAPQAVCVLCHALLACVNLKWGKYIFVQNKTLSPEFSSDRCQ